MAVPYYNVGTATLTNGSAAMTGHGTLWVGNVRPGDQIVSHFGATAIVGTVNSNTSITLIHPFFGANQSTSYYEIVYTPDDPFTQTLARQVLQSVSGSALVGLGSLTPAARTMPYFDLTGAAALADLSDFARTLLDDAGATDMRDTLDVPSRAENTILPCGRLTLVAGVAVPASDVAGATTIHYVPSIGHNLVPINDGTRFVPRSIGAGISLPLDNNTGHPWIQYANLNYDVFVFDDVGTLKIGTSPWLTGAVVGTDTARGIGAGSCELELYNGLLVNKNSLSLRWGDGLGDIATTAARRATYVGSFRPKVNGQAADTRASRLLFNAYNQCIKPIGVRDVAASWTYSTGEYRQANGNTDNKIELLFGLDGIAASVELGAVVSPSAGGQFASCGIGLDSVTTLAPLSISGLAFAGITEHPTTPLRAKYDGYPGLGYHYLAWLEYGAGTGTQTWHGTDNDTGNLTGMSGTVLG